VQTTVNAFPTGGGGISQRHLTSNYVVLATDNNVYFDNLGAAAEVDVTLPAAPATAQVNAFVVATAQNFRVVAPAGVSIAIGQETGAAGGNVVSILPASTITLYALSTTLWVAISMTGSWALT
jgi:hypothetical protein